MIYIGLISYPLYLWHWPILSFARMIHFKEPTDLVKVACIAAGVRARSPDLSIHRAADPVRPADAAQAGHGVDGAGGGRMPRPADLCGQRNPVAVSEGIAERRRRISATTRPRTSRQYRCLYQRRRRGRPSRHRATAPISRARSASCCGAIPTPAHLGPGTRRASPPGTTSSWRNTPPPAARRSCGFVSERQKDCPELNEFVAAQDRASSSRTRSSWPARWEIYDGTGASAASSRRTFKPPSPGVKALGVSRIVVIGPVSDLARAGAASSAPATTAWPQLGLRARGQRRRTGARQAFLKPIDLRGRTR